MVQLRSIYLHFLFSSSLSHSWPLASCLSASHITRSDPVKMRRNRRQEQRQLQQNGQARHVEGVLEGGRNMAAWRVHVRPPVEHVVGAENQHSCPSQPTLNKGKLLPAECGGNRR